MTKPLVSIIIPNFNGEKYLRICLNSVLKTSYYNFEVLLIDDGSTDNSSQVIRGFQRKDKRIIFIKNSKNIGAAASRNKAIKSAKGEIIVFLDNDTEVDKNWLGELIEPLLWDTNIGTTQALLLDFNKRNLIQMAGGHLIPQTGWLLPFYQWKKYSDVKDKLKESEIVGISATLAVKKEVFEKIGGFDEKEAIYTEDLDFCWRIWIAGYKIVLAPDSRVFHWTKSVEERSGMKASYKQIYFHLAKNSFRSILKNYEFKNILRYLPLTIAINIFRGFLVLFRDKNFSALAGSLLGMLWNITNIKDTLKRRADVQGKRELNDDYLMSKIFIHDSLFSVYNRYFRKIR